MFGITELCPVYTEALGISSIASYRASSAIMNVCRSSVVLEHVCAFTYACLSVVNIRFLVTENLE
jgi:hypothetical protein